MAGSASTPDSYRFLPLPVSPYPGFGTLSTVVVEGLARASDTRMNCPFEESRPRSDVLLSLLMV